MRILVVLALLTAFSQSVQAHLLEEAWEKYAAKAPAAKSEIVTPGKIIGTAQGRGESDFSYPWKYRSQTYELHFEQPEALAQSVYALALFAHDVSPDLPREKFFGGVLGFHYSAAKICAWLNDSIVNKKPLSGQENKFVGLLLADGVIGLGVSGFQPTGRIKHVLGAAPGKKRDFARNLLHERLHVFWDEDGNFRKREEQAWAELPEPERGEAEKTLKNYAKDNKAQLLEEWAIKRAENSRMTIK